MKKFTAIWICLFLIAVLSACQSGKTSKASLDSFRFFLTWNCYGDSSYDSESGKLIKQKAATNPEEYTTIYHLTDEQKQKIYDLITELDVNSYPDKYDPYEGEVYSTPSMTLILTVKTDTIEKTIRAENIALAEKAGNKKGQKFLDVCEEISTILVSTDAWEALPEYEFLYS